MILRPSGGEHGMLAQGGGGEFDKDVVDGGDRVLECRREGFELLAKGEQRGGIAASGDRDGHGSLAAVHEPCGDGAPHGRERHLFHAGGRGRSGGGEDIALSDAATVAGGCECGEINAMLFGGSAGAGACGWLG